MQLQQKQDQLSLVFPHRTLFPNGWEKVKSKSQFFSNRPVMLLRPLFLLMKLIPYVVHEVKTMRMKHLDESKQNFLYECRVYAMMNVLVLAATNTPYALDQAMRKRFDKRIYVPLPDLKAREHIFKVYIGDTPHNLTETDFEHLARRTQEKNSKGMWVPCKRTQQGAIEITFQELNARGLALKIQPPPNTRADFDKCLLDKSQL